MINKNQRDACIIAFAGILLGFFIINNWNFAEVLQPFVGFCCDSVYILHSR